jgi:hypothetical protein
MVLEVGWPIVVSVGAAVVVVILAVVEQMVLLELLR